MLITYGPFKASLMLASLSALFLTSSGCSKAQLLWEASGLNTTQSSAISAMSPTQGTSTGGFTLSFTGTGFSQGAVTIHLGSTACTPVNVSSDTSVTCTVPALAPGNYVVAMMVGSTSLTFPTVYVSVNGPTITSVTPSAGPLAGGTVITIQGTGFLSGASIALGSAGACSSPAFLSSTQYQCTTPSATTGSVSLTLTNADSQSSTSSGAYTYQPAPTIATITPAGGALAGGTTLTLNGNDFLTGATVAIGGTPCAITSVTPNVIECMTPGASTGNYTVVVTNSDGQFATSPATYAYNPAPSVSSVSPTAGALAGGTTLTVNGSGFLGSPSIAVGAGNCALISVSSSTQVTCTLPTGSAGAANVTVTNTDSQAGTLAGAYIYRAAPSLSSISPIGGPISGASTLTLTGTGFVSGASVAIGGASCAPISLTSSTITCTIPGPYTGPKSVIVTNTDGQASGTQTYTYSAAPVLTSVSPAGGPLAGSTSITLTGSGFINGATVNIAGSTCTGVSVVSASQITCTTPSGSGLRAVTVTNPDTQASTLSSSYTYSAAPIVSSISPVGGSTTGGTSITLSGSGFLSGATATIGGSPCSPLNVVNSSTITCTTGSHAQGAATVQVVNSDSQLGNLTNGYAYNPAPTLSGVSPSAGPLGGGTSITLTGTGFLASAAVSIGGGTCTALNVVSATQITCLTPSHSIGSQTITVTNTDNQSASGQTFTYNTAPTLSSVSPSAGALAGGTTLTVNGSGFSGTPTVTVGGNPCTGVTVGSAIQLTCTLPSGTAGAANVVLTNPDSQTATLAGAYTYQPAPTLTVIAPSSGALAGGPITLTGTGFVAFASVTIGGSTCTGVNVVSATQITCTAPAHIAGVKSVIVTNADGQASSSRNYTYIPAPTLVSIAPSAGALAGGTAVTLTGTDFVTGATVDIGGAACAGVTVVTATQITCTTSSSSSGLKSATVTNPDTQSTTLASAYSYNAAPSVALILPNAGPLAGGTAVTITGSGFLSGASVMIGGSVCTGPIVASATSITCTTSSHGAGTATIVVTNTDSQFGSLTNGYSYNAAPTFTAITPGAGPLAGNTAVTLTGTGFLSGATVDIGGSACSGVNVVNPTQITCNTPALTSGSRTVTINNTDGQSASGQTYSYNIAPSLSSISPQGGSLAGGTFITIDGTGFLVGASVTVGGGTCSGATISPTQITCYTPGGSAGVKSIIVSNPDSQSATLSSSYTYQNAPTVTSVTPSGGALGGGTAVTITGTGFLSGATVGFGGSACTGLNVASSTSITCVTTSHTTGAVSVQVINTDNQFDGLAAAFSYNPAPTIATVSPSSGATGGGTNIAIYGTGFISGVTVMINGSVCTSPVVTGSTQIVCTTDPHSAGIYSLLVTNPDGQSATGGTYEYSVAPSITSISPLGGPLAGGTSVTVNGSGFVNGALVKIGSTSCASTSFVSATQLTCVTDSSAGGTFAVTVVNPDLQQGTLSSAYSYQAAPTVVSVSPTVVDAAGGTTITVNGTGFAAGIAVVTGSNCNAVNIISATQLTCNTAPVGAGSYVVFVTNSDSQYNASGPPLTFAIPPSASSVTPNLGRTAGGDVITISGSGFASPTVTIGGTSCNVTGSSASSITCTTLAHSQGSFPVVVTNGIGLASTGGPSFNYNPPPTLAGITPSSGSTLGSQSVTINGTGFLSGASVMFGPTPCTLLNVVSPTTLTCTTPASAAGAVNLAITNPDGQVASLLSAYTFVAPPMIAGILPTTGSTSGTTPISINGTDFSAGATVQVGGISCTNVKVDSAALITCTTAAHSGGSADIVVINPDTQYHTLFSAYTYVAPQSFVASFFGALLSASQTWITGIEPSSGKGDGSLSTNAIGAYVSGDSTSLYISDKVNDRIVKIDKTTGTVQGWIGSGSTTPPTGGTAGCISVVNGGPMPGWCTGGIAGGGTPLQGAARPYQPSQTTVYGGKLYVADGGSARIAKFDTFTGVFEGWIGKVGATLPTNDANCPSPITNSPTPGWCTGGFATSASTDGALTAPKGIAADSSYLYVTDASARISRFNRTTGLFAGWRGKINTLVPTMGGDPGCSAATAGQITPGWCTGGTSITGTGDGMLSASPGGLWIDGTTLYVADTTNSRIQKLDLSTGTWGGWVGYGGTMSTATGAAGCTNLTTATITPGWCSGGTAYTTNTQKQGSAYQVTAVAVSGSGELLAIGNSAAAIHKWDALSGASTGWTGQIGSSVPTSPSGCMTAGINGITPVWCTAGGLTNPSGTFLDGSLKSAYGLWVDSTDGKIYVVDAQSRVSRFNLFTGTFEAWWGAKGSVTAGWNTSGTPARIVSDGGYTLPRGAVTDGTYIYATDSGLHRVTRTLLSTGIAAGWIGGAAGPATSGAGGCTSMTVGSVTPGWCNGGLSALGGATTQGGLNSPNHLVYVAGSLYVADSSNHRISRYSASTGTFTGWIGYISSAATGGACTGLSAQAAPGWCTGGSSSSNAIDGGLNSPQGITSDGVSLFVTDSLFRVSKYDLATGAFQGSIGKTSASIVTGACTGTPSGTAVPGWCTGGTYATGTGDGMFGSTRGLSTANGYLYVADAGNWRIQRFLISNGSFQGWIGNAGATPPTGGALGCVGTANNFPVPGWCTGGVAASGGNGTTGGFAQPMGIWAEPSKGYLYVSDASLGRISRHYLSTGAPLGWYGKIYGTSPTGGSPGCTSTTTGMVTPGWCVGGQSTTTGGGVAEIGSPDALFWLGSALYFSDGGAKITKILGLDGI